MIKNKSDKHVCENEGPETNFTNQYVFKIEWLEVWENA